MKRREFAFLGASVAGALYAPIHTTAAVSRMSDALQPPAGRPIRAGFLITKDAAVIDFAGPWEVFNNICLPAAKLGIGGFDYGQSVYTPFARSIVAEKIEPVAVSGAMSIMPNYNLSNAPQFDVLVMGAQRHPSDAATEWIRGQARHASVVMSVCTGAFVLAATGLLDGLSATTHHDAYARFEKSYPKVHLIRGVRYVEHEKFASAGGLTSGIDLALRVVERYYGPRERAFTAGYMEYEPSVRPSHIVA